MRLLCLLSSSDSKDAISLSNLSGSGVAKAVVIVVLLGAVGTVAYIFGGGGRPESTRTISATTTTTQTEFSGTLLQIQTQTVNNVVTVTSTATETTSTTTTTSTTSTTTMTRTLGTGVMITNYQLYMVNVAPDSVFQLSLTINLASNEFTSGTETASIILTPSGGNTNDIKFIPNPISIQMSNSTSTLTMYVIVDHQIVAGTYIIEYLISTSQGSAVAFTVLEII